MTAKMKLIACQLAVSFGTYGCGLSSILPILTSIVICNIRK
jgi:hypothetical protein